MIAVRVLALTSVLLAVIVVLEGMTVRRARAEVQQVRAERDRGRAELVASWTRESIDDVDGAIRWLDGFYGDPGEGLGRAGGLCANGRLNDRAVATFVFGSYLPARAAGRSHESSLAEMKGKVQSQAAGDSTTRPSNK